MTNTEKIEKYNEAAKDAKQTRNKSIRSNIFSLCLDVCLLVVNLFNGKNEILTVVLTTCLVVDSILYIRDIISAQRIYQLQVSQEIVEKDIQNQG